MTFEEVGATNVQKLSMEHLSLLKRDENYLIHAWNCKDFNCSSEGCSKMKQLILHTHECKIHGCRICKSTLILCYYHVWVCKNDRTCDLPFCSVLWQKMSLQIKFQEAVKDIEGFSEREIAIAIELNLQLCWAKKKILKETNTYVSVTLNRN